MLNIFDKSQCTVSSNGLYTAGRLPAQILRVFIIIMTVVIIIIIIMAAVVIIIIIIIISFMQGIYTIFLRQTVSLGNIVLQLFCCYYSWCLYR